MLSPIEWTANPDKHIMGKSKGVFSSLLTPIQKRGGISVVDQIHLWKISSTCHTQVVRDA